MASSLDDLLREIEAEQGGSLPPAETDSAGLENLPTYESESHRPNSSPFLVPEMIGQVPQLTREMVGGGTVVSEQAITPQALSARQRALPKISLHMVGSVLAMLVLMIGLGSSVLLSQRTQDVRQQAYEGQGVVEQQTGNVPAELEGTSETTVETQGESVALALTEIAPPWWQQPIVIAGLAVVVSAALLLAAFFHWLFAA